MRYAQIFLLVFFTCSLLHAHERIVSFISDIKVNADATLKVQEKITVFSEQKEILHGIVREFPTNYRNVWGAHYSVDFNIESITHNGYTVPYTIESASNGKKIYIGNKDTLLFQGEHLYVITYTTNRQLGFFNNHDEIYWNVTGTGWRLPIEKVQAYIQLPEGISFQSIRAQAYTGYQGEKGKNYTYSIQDTSVTFTTNHALKKYEGLTIVAAFPKGYIKKPSWYQTVYWFFQDNFLIFLICIFLFLLIILLILGIIDAQRINAPGIIIPKFYPPTNMMPCDVGFINKMQFNNLLLSADIIDLAVRNCITITYKPNILYGGIYTLTIKDSIDSLCSQQNLTDYNATLLQALFDKKESITVSKQDTRSIKAALDACKTYAEKNNSSYITVLTNFLYAVITTSFFLVCSCFAFLYTIQATTGSYIIIGALTTLFVIPFFHQMLKVYTPAGRDKQDDIEGFKLYLLTAEIERMNLIGTPPTKTPELYEKYLPYAMALGIEQQWTMQFSTIFKNFAQDKGHSYYPVWYHGPIFKIDKFGSEFRNSFTSAIASASTPPGSSSGSGGKGRSGGGGGGGGGGGW